MFFAKASTKSIATDLMKSDFWLPAQLCTYHRIVRVAKCFRINPDALSFLREDKGAALGITYVVDIGQLAETQQFNVPLLQAAAHFVLTPPILKRTS